MDYESIIPLLEETKHKYMCICTVLYTLYWPGVGYKLEYIQHVLMCIMDSWYDLYYACAHTCSTMEYVYSLAQLVS